MSIVFNKHVFVLKNSSLTGLYSSLFNVLFLLRVEIVISVPIRNLPTLLEVWLSMLCMTYSIHEFWIVIKLVKEFRLVLCNSVVWMRLWYYSCLYKICLNRLSIIWANLKIIDEVLYFQVLDVFFFPGMYVYKRDS